jgi:hypothetical protein
VLAAPAVRDNQMIQPCSQPTRMWGLDVLHALAGSASMSPPQSNLSSHFRGSGCACQALLLLNGTTQPSSVVLTHAWLRGALLARLTVWRGDQVTPPAPSDGCQSTIKHATRAARPTIAEARTTMMRCAPEAAMSVGASRGLVDSTKGPDLIIYSVLITLYSSVHRR